MAIHPYLWQKINDESMKVIFCDPKLTISRRFNLPFA